MADTLRKIGEEQTIVAARPAATSNVVESGVPFTASTSQSFYTYKGKNYSTLRAVQRANIRDICDSLQLDANVREEIIDIFPHFIARMTEYPTVQLYKSKDGKFFATSGEATKHDTTIAAAAQTDSPKEVQIEK